MHLEHHQDRRLAHAKALHKQYRTNPTVCFVDTADYPGHRAVVAVVVIRREMQPRLTQSLRPTRNGEKVAVAFEITGTQATTSQTPRQPYATISAVGSPPQPPKPQFQGMSAWYGRQLTRGTIWHRKQPEDSRTRLTSNPTTCRR